MAGLPVEGATFGRYDLGRRIGRGGMGVVFEATHRELQRPVALKVLLAEMLDVEAFRHRFIREARALAAVDSPHIVPVFDAGEQDGWLFIATKLFADGDLGEWITRHGALTEAESVAVMSQVAEGLADAHEAGFLHRDIKPSNILLQRRPAGLRAVICDFGIALAEGNEHTKTVGVIGTLGYMAPERHEGLPATAASDIYSLGCLLYACLTGQAPWTGTDVKVAMGHLYEPVPQLPDAREALNHLLARALAKDPAERYGTALEFREALLDLEASAMAVAPVAEPAPQEPVDLHAATIVVSPLGALALTGADDVPESDEVQDVEDVQQPEGHEADAAEVVEPALRRPAEGDERVAGAPSVDETILAEPAVAEDRTLVPSGDQPREGGASGRRWWRTWWAVAAAVLLIGGFASVPFLLDGGGGGAPRAAAEPVEPSTTASTSSSITAPISLTTQSGDLSVDFHVHLPGGTNFEWRRDAAGAAWFRSSANPLTLATLEGGKRVCILARLVDEVGSLGAGPSTRTCGSSKPKTLALKLAGACTPAAATCTAVRLIATGLPKNALFKPTLYVNGDPDAAECTDADGKSTSCFLSRAGANGRVDMTLQWTVRSGSSEFLTLEGAGLETSVRVG